MNADAEKEMSDMCNLSSYVLDKGIAEGMEKGRAEGILSTLNGLVRDKILTVSEAAKRADMSVEAFSKAVVTL